ncbi:adenylate kinase [Ructibacterium gallinarum]|uniref:Adenylate kinase n=1 Tax=Ructibacterium gallinarum TaxID=2779355 RepID=A0A9D5R7L5_9FIRM|nr:adenylate kinase [Ructibacterium gallinarum]MBE5038920.1 adenylate kinase [Ructibacterium gallinarum]
MRLILLAAPGAGKGTQAEKLSEHFGIPTISTGAILRHNIQEGTELGKLAKTYIDGGNLIPDDIMIQVMDDRLSKEDCKNGFILDGFPRTLAQAEALDASSIQIDKVLNIEVPDEKIIARLSGRLECSQCAATFHTEYRKPKVEGVCDNCGGKLVTRADDKPETVKSRLAVYHTQTEPLLKYYSDKGMLRTAHGQEEIADTTAEVLKALED